MKFIHVTNTFLRPSELLLHKFEELLSGAHGKVELIIFNDNSFSSWNELFITKLLGICSQYVPVIQVLFTDKAVSNIRSLSDLLGGYKVQLLSGYEVNIRKSGFTSEVSTCIGAIAIHNVHVDEIKEVGQLHKIIRGRVPIIDANKAVRHIVMLEGGTTDGIENMLVGARTSCIILTKLDLEDAILAECPIISLVDMDTKQCVDIFYNEDNVVDYRSQIRKTVYRPDMTISEILLTYSNSTEFIEGSQATVTELTTLQSWINTNNG